MCILCLWLVSDWILLQMSVCSGVGEQSTFSYTCADLGSVRASVFSEVTYRGKVDALTAGLCCGRCRGCVCVCRSATRPCLQQNMTERGVCLQVQSVGICAAVARACYLRRWWSSGATSHSLLFLSYIFLLDIRYKFESEESLFAFHVTLAIISICHLWCQWWKISYQ